MGKRERKIFRRGGIEFQIETTVHPVTARTVVETALEENQTLRNRLARLLGRKNIKRVDVINKEGGSNHRGLGRLHLHQNQNRRAVGRVVVFAERVERLAEGCRKKGLPRNRVRKIAADQTVYHEIRHLTCANEERTRRYSEKKTRKKHGAYFAG